MYTHCSSFWACALNELLLMWIFGIYSTHHLYMTTVVNTAYVPMELIREQSFVGKANQDRVWGTCSWKNIETSQGFIGKSEYKNEFNGKWVDPKWYTDKCNDKSIAHTICILNVISNYLFCTICSTKTEYKWTQHDWTWTKIQAQDGTLQSKLWLGNDAPEGR